MDCSEPVYNILSAFSMLFSVVAMAIARKSRSGVPKKKKTFRKKIVSSDGVVYKEL